MSEKWIEDLELEIKNLRLLIERSQPKEQESDQPSHQIIRGFTDAVPTFNGKSGSSISDFLYKVDVFLHLSPISSELLIIDLVTTCFLDDALQWWLTHIRGTTETDPKRIKTWTDLRSALLIWFTPPEEKQELYSHLSKLTQSSTVSKYVEEFQSIPCHVEVPPELLEQFFIKGLNPDVVCWITSSGSALSDLDAIVKAAHCYDLLINLILELKLQQGGIQAFRAIAPQFN
ncbi:hypothetical protein HMI55_003917 [Coelomomyces lativittatus]|nr:hypothetical protein HMI55_003917 [Coelomomyces lativittatus]